MREDRIRGGRCAGLQWAAMGSASTSGSHTDPPACPAASADPSTHVMSGDMACAAPPVTHRRPASPSPRTRSLLPSSTPGGTRSEMRLLPLQHTQQGVGGEVSGVLRCFRYHCIPGWRRHPGRQASRQRAGGGWRHSPHAAVALAGAAGRELLAGAAAGGAGGDLLEHPQGGAHRLHHLPRALAGAAGAGRGARLDAAP